MNRYTGQAERPGGHAPGATYLHATLNASDVKESACHGVATVIITWGRRGSTATSDNEEMGREEYTRLGVDIEEAIERARDAALAEQKGESRRYVEMAASRALLAVLEERDFWRCASEVAAAFVDEWGKMPPSTHEEMVAAVRAVTRTERQTTAVMDLIGVAVNKIVAQATAAAKEDI